ncbi:hypothetical protein Tco_0539111, partial [Tanacetum coccineum]
MVSLCLPCNHETTNAHMFSRERICFKIKGKFIVKGKVYWIRIRELEPWSPELDDEFCESSSDDEFVGDEKNNSNTGDANDHVSESSFMNENIENVINEQE